MVVLRMKSDKQKALNKGQFPFPGWHAGSENLDASHTVMPRYRPDLVPHCLRCQAFKIGILHREHTSVLSHGRHPWMSTGRVLPHLPGLVPVIQPCTATSPRGSLQPCTATPPTPHKLHTAAPGSAQTMRPWGCSLARSAHEQLPWKEPAGSQTQSMLSLQPLQVPEKQSKTSASHRQPAGGKGWYLLHISEGGHTSKKVTSVRYSSSLKLWLQLQGHSSQGTEPTYALNNSLP